MNTTAVEDLSPAACRSCMSPMARHATGLGADVAHAPGAELRARNARGQPRLAGQNGEPDRRPECSGRPSGHAGGGAIVTAAVASGQRAGGADGLVAGQSLAALPPVAVMTAVVQPRGQDGVQPRCLACGQMFTARRRDRRTCTRRCAATLWPSRAKTRERAESRSCADADCDMVLPSGRSDRRFCSDRCRKRAQRRRRQGDAQQLTRSP